MTNHILLRPYFVNLKHRPLVNSTEKFTRVAAGLIIIIIILLSKLAWTVTTKLHRDRKRSLRTTPSLYFDFHSKEWFFKDTIILILIDLYRSFQQF